jgi:predicted GNAT family N-acyltransferase
MINVKHITDLKSKEAQHLFAIRNEVFVIEQKVDHQLEHDAYEETAAHYLAYIDDIPCGAARYRQTEKGIKLERFAVLADFRNKKIGVALLKKVLEDCLSSNKKIYLHAQITAYGFYLKNGFIEDGEHFFEAGIEHVVMIYNNK